MKTKKMHFWVLGLLVTAFIFTACSKGDEPILTTAVVSDIGKSSVMTGGNITSDEGSDVTERGVCWSTSAKPTISDNKTTDGSGTGSFKSHITGLAPNTTYYIRAYATSDAGTGYGEEVVFTTAPADIGESYLGGRMAYILHPGDPGYSMTTAHGFIVANTHTEIAEWGCFQLIGTSTAIGSGKANTNAIISKCSDSDVIARLCYNFESGGYDDWYLPSINELEKIYLNRVAIGITQTLNYWSSTEADENFAWILAFANGYKGDNHKTNPLRAWPIRYF